MSLKPWLFFLIMLLLISGIKKSYAQGDTTGKKQTLQVQFTGKDSSFSPQELRLQQSFKNREELNLYINKLPRLLNNKGYPLASVDTLWYDHFGANVTVYAGPKASRLELDVSAIDRTAFNKATTKMQISEPVKIEFSQLGLLQENLLKHYENNGYPFASVYLDSILMKDGNVVARLRSDLSVFYKVDSIRVIGNAKINNRFLHRYLSLPPASPYNKQLLSGVDKRINDLPYVTQIQPSDVTLLGSGSVLNLYLQQKKSSQVNFLVGFLPSGNNTGKLQLTGDANLDLKNLLGSGERILFKWQQLQPKSPRLNLGFNQPYIFRSAFGFDFLFDLFKKDSSFLQINAQAGLQYDLSAQQTGKVFLQLQNTSLLSGGIDTNFVKFQKRLPPNIDMRAISIGVSYDFRNTDYRFNPRKGIELSILSGLGIKTIKRSSEITSLTDPAFDYSSLYDSIKPETYQIRAKVSGAKYLPAGRFGVFKGSVAGGIFISPSIFRNELFQLGGFNLLRGFDEESIYASQYGVGTIEYRYLVGMNSYFFFFVDGGLVKNKFQQVNVNNSFIGTGLGLLFETKFGLLNISYALGKRNDVKFNIREASKLHFGYLNYF